MNLNRTRGRLGACPIALAAAAVSFALVAPVSAQTWISRVNGEFSNPDNWAGGTVPAPGANLVFTNLGHSSYRAFNDLGILPVNSITLHTRTGTATFIGQNPGSAFEFGNGSFIRSTDAGLFRFGGVTGVTNDWRLTGNLTLQTDSWGNTYVAAPISGTGSLTVVSGHHSETDGFFRLEGANSFSGGVFLNSGVLEIGNAAGLGTGTLHANGGAFRTTTSLNVGNNIVANSDLNLRTTAGMTLSGVISGPGGVDLRSVGSIHNTVTLTNANTYTGATTLDLPVASGAPSGFPGQRAGTIVLSNDGSILGTSALNLRNGGILELNYTANPGMNRVSDTAPVNFTNGRITALGNNTAGNNTLERVGPMTFHGGQNILFINGRNGGMDLSTASITRSNRATGLLSHANAISHLSVDSGPAMVNGIVPWFAGAPSTTSSPRDLVTYDAGRLRTLTAGEYSNTLTAGPTANVKLPGGSSAAHSWIHNDDTVTVNALVVPDWTGISGTGTINVASGALLVAFGQETSIDNNINFGAAEGIIHTGSISTINGVISGSNGLTKSGDFSLTTTATHTYTGVTTINGGGFRFSNPNTFDSTSGFVSSSLGGFELVPSLEYRGTGTAVIDKPAVSQSGAFRLSASTAGNNALEYAGVISGPGAVYLESQTTNTGRLILSADNTYSGGTRIFNAEVEINRDANLGAPDGILEIMGTSGAGIVLTGDWNTTRPISVQRVTRIDTNGFDAHWAGTLDSGSNLTKVGAGTWRITPDGIANGGAAGWAVGSATSTTSTYGGRVEIDGDVRMNWSVWDGTLAVDGTVRILNTFSLGGGQAILAPGDIGGPGVGSVEAFSIVLARGSRVEFDLGADSDLIRSVTTFGRGTGDGPVTFDFRVGEGIAESTYTLVHYHAHPSASQLFEVGDLAFTSNVDGFDGFFDFTEFADGTLGLQFTVTVIPEPGAMALAGLGGLALLRRRRA